MKFISLWIVFLSFNCLAYAQRGNYTVGARSMGLSGTCITIEDEYAAFNNIAGLASLKTTSVSFASSILFEITGLLMTATSFNRPMMKGSVTVNFYRFGDQLLNEHKIGIGYSRKIHSIALGVQVDYLQTMAAGYGTAGMMGIEVGGIVRLHTSFLYGLYVFQPVMLIFSYAEGGELPTILKSGLSFRPVEGLMLNAEYCLQVYEEHYLSVGLEYIVRGMVSLRTGFTVNTLRSSFGFGWTPGRYSIDYALSIHPLLGFSHALAVSVKIKD